VTDDARLAALEAKVQELEAMVTLSLRLLSLEKPVSALLARYGATDSEELAVHALLDDVARRAKQGGMYEPTLGGFREALYERFPAVRHSHDFVALLLDTLKLDRPIYRELHDFVIAQRWIRQE
jgi:hypothetical protein